MKLYFKPVFVMLFLALASCENKTEPDSGSEVSEGQPAATTVKGTQDQLKEATDNANNQLEENLEEDSNSPPSVEEEDLSSGEEEDILPEEKEKQEAEMVDEEEEYEPMPTD